MTSKSRSRARALAIFGASACLVAAGQLATGPVMAATSGPPASGAACRDASSGTATFARCEAWNLSLSLQNISQHTGLLPGVAVATARYQASRLRELAADPERSPNPNPCSVVVACPIDPRVSTNSFKRRGGLVEPVLYTSRSGATMSGHVWAIAKGAAKRPGVVITNGSIIGYEQVYWYLAQTLARSGFVVLTWDAQGEGNSDQFGQGRDALEAAFAATPGFGFLQGEVTGDVLGGNGLTFYDGVEDALDFFLSTPKRHYTPRKSRSGTSHAAKQRRRVASRHNDAHNPLWSLLDRRKIGLTGHSYGAFASAWQVQGDPRVTTGVALDNLCYPTSPAEDEAASLLRPNPDFGSVPASSVYGFQPNCLGAPNGPAPKITKPMLGISGDYVVPVAYTTRPNPAGKSRASRTFSKAGVDTGQIVIRGGTHLDFTDAPGALPATLRGIDMTAWYTNAWFLKYLKGSKRGDAMLRTTRWQRDPATGALDNAQDPNLLSWHFRSRMDITTNGKRWRCEDLRDGCRGQTRQSNDGYDGPYSFVAAR